MLIHVIDLRMLVTMFFHVKLRSPVEAFYTKAGTIKQIIPKEFLDLLESYEYEVAAILKEPSVAEIYLIPLEPTEEVSQSFLSLSQLYPQDE